MKFGINTLKSNVERNSNFELLRLVCIFGVVSVHTFGFFFDSARGINLMLGVLSNSVFEMAVSIFMLISGYWRIKFSLSKFIQLLLEVWFYSLLRLSILLITNGITSFEEIKSLVFPIISWKYWYITAYILIFIFSKYINQIAENMNRENFQNLILLLVVVFYIIPTITQIHLVRDEGKDVITMFIVYMIGMYIRNYDKGNIRKLKLLFIGIANIGSVFLINYITSLTNGGKGAYIPLAKDDCIFILVGSVAIFLLFKDISFHSKFVNFVAKGVCGIYLFEGPMRKFFLTFFDLFKYENSIILFPVISILVVIIMISCLFIDYFRRILFRPINGMLVRFIEKINPKLSVGN